MKEEKSSLSEVFTSLNMTSTSIRVLGTKSIPMVKMLPVKNGNYLETRTFNGVENGITSHTEGAEEYRNLTKSHHHNRNVTEGYFNQKSPSIHRRESVWKSSKLMQEKTDLLLNLQVPQLLPKYFIKSFPGSEIGFDNHECKNLKNKYFRLY